MLQGLIPSMRVLWSDVTAYQGLARGTFINRNHFAGYIEMVFFIILGYCLSFGRYGRRHKRHHHKKILTEDTFSPSVLLGIILVLILMALLFSQSRAGIASIFIGFFTFALLMHGAKLKLPVGIKVGITAIVGLVLLYGVRIGFGSIISRFTLLGSQEISRFDIWRDSWAIVQDHALGIGLANFEYVFPIYKVHTVIDRIFAHAHNDVLQLLIESGWPGFITLMGAYIIYVYNCVRGLMRMRPTRDPLRFFIAVGALSGIAALSFHSFFDFNLQIPSNCVYFVMLLSMANASIAARATTDISESDTRSHRRRRKRYIRSSRKHPPRAAI